MRSTGTSSLDKRLLRRQMRARRDAIPPDLRAAWSAAICRRAIDLPAYRAARVIHCYLPIQSEVDAQPIIAHALAGGKRVAVPIFVKGNLHTPCSEIASLDDDQFTLGGFGLRVPRAIRPVALDRIDLVFVPLLAFAPAGAPVPPRQGRWARLGYGAGYYDVLLSRVGSGTWIAGLAFAAQRIAALPVEPHDMLLDEVVTEAG